MTKHYQNIYEIRRQMTCHHIQVTVLNAHIRTTPEGRGYSKARTANKWKKEIGWWLEIIRLPEGLLPKQPQIIFTTNERRLEVQTKQIISK